MKKKLIVLGLVAMMVLGVTYVYAHGPGYGPGRRGETCWESSDPGKASALTPEQTTQFQELRRKFEQETAQIKGAILTKRMELQSLWADPKADSKAIMDKEKELQDLQNQMRDKVIESKLEARKILTPEQIAEFGPSCGWGPGFGRGYKRGQSHGMGPGYGMGHGYGRGPGSGPCH